MELDGPFSLELLEVPLVLSVKTRRDVFYGNDRVVVGRVELYYDSLCCDRRRVDQ